MQEPMKRKTHIYFFPAVVFQVLVTMSAYTQQPHIFLPEPMKGRVKSVEWLDDGNRRTTEYDTAGRVLHFTADVFGCAEPFGLYLAASEWFYEWDLQGRLLSASHHYTYMISAPEPGEETDHTTDYSFSHDKKGRLATETWYNSFVMDDPGGRLVYRHDGRGRVKSCEEFIWNGESFLAENLTRYKYDSQDRVVGEQEYRASDGKIQLSRSRTFVYAEEGLKSESYYSDPGSSERHEYTTEEKDALGRCVRRIVYDHDTVMRYGDFYRYDSALTWHDRLSCTNGKVTGRSVECRNLQGDIVRSIYYKADKSVEADVQYEHEYDARGNWVRVTRRRDGRDDCAEERKIVYWGD